MTENNQIKTRLKLDNYSFEDQFQVLPRTKKLQKKLEDKPKPNDSIFEKRTQPKQKKKYK